jgi:DNA invertase Pin-like site-specific DNA recombinase
LTFPPSPAITYYRVSTQQQVRSGLGIDAARSRNPFRRCRMDRDCSEYMGMESSKGAEALDRRPELEKSE